MPPEVLASTLVKIIQNATLHNFGVLTSNVHMAWVRAVCGRLEMRYRCSEDIVYNNFPQPGRKRANQIYRLFFHSSLLITGNILY
jgi:hypothetical protein